MFRPSRRAFTLVELLVVIGIIAVLIAILLPALNKARDAARTVACQSNMRQIGLAAMQYMQEYKGHLPGRNLWETDPLAPAAVPTGTYSGDSPFWYDYLAPYMGVKSYPKTFSARFNAGGTVALDYTRAMKAFWCPNDPTYDRNDPWRVGSYGMPATVYCAYAIPPVTSGWGDPLSISPRSHFFRKVRHPAAVALLGEVGGRAWFYGYIFMQQDTSPLAIDPGGARYQHGKGGLNYLYFDGHVARTDIEPHALARGPVAGFYADGSTWLDEGIDTFVAREGSTK